MTATVERQDIRPGVYSQALEITWLAVIFLIPLFFSPQSHHVFILNKAALLQFLVVAMLAFWVADWLLSGASRRKLTWQGIFASPLHLTILAFGLVAVLATAASITPAISFWGAILEKRGCLL
jgi:hypothetical protein